MNAAGMTIIYRVDLDAPQNVIWIGTLLVQGDDNAHKIVVELYRGREKHVPADGVTALGVFVRSDGYAVALGGDIAGNTVSITLDGACYAVAGPCYLSMVLNDQGGERTVLKAAGRVDQNENNGYIDETVYTSFDALVEAAVNAYLGGTIPGGGGGGITGPYVSSVNGKSGAVTLKTGDMENNSGFITKAVSDLTNYYLKSETYTREEINQRISQIPKFAISVVSTLPATGDVNTIYLVGGGISGNLYTEYIWTNGAWEILGSQRVDLTGYATETWVNGQLSSYLKASELTNAINTALAQAAASGQFDGADGVGVESVSVTRSPDENGFYYITLTLTDGQQEVIPYKNGADGVSISSIQQTTTSAADGGTNVITVTLSNGQKFTFEVKNGSKGTDATVTSANIASALGYTPADDAALAQKSDIYNAWEAIALDVVTGALLKTTRYVHTYASGKYAEVVVESYSQLEVTGYQWDTSSDFALCSFYDENKAHISSVKLTSSTQYTNYVVDVPSNAFTVVVNGNVNNAMGVTGLKVYDCKTLGDEKANRIARWVTPTIEIKDKYIISANGKSEQSQTDGELGIIDVSAYQKVIVTGYQYDLSYGFDVCCFYDASGGLISQHQGSTSAKKTTLSLDVPANAATLKVTGQRYEAHVEVQAYQVFDVDDLYEAVRPQGKKVITLGDSITALGTGSTGWVKYFLEKTGCELIANVAVNGAWLMDKSGTTYDGNPVFDGSDNNVNNVLGNQVQKIINNAYTAPDIILIAIGTNNGISITKDQIKAAYYDSSNALISLDSVDRTTSAGAYRWCNEKLQTLYPNAIIFWCTPIMGYQTTRSAENAMAYAESLRIATEYSGQIMIDTIRCGISGVFEKKDANGRFLVDGLHPNANGAKKIGYYNASKVLPFLGNSFTVV